MRYAKSECSAFPMGSCAYRLVGKFCVMMPGGKVV